MTLRAAIFASISSLAISLYTALPAAAQHRVDVEQETVDSTALFNGFAVSVDLAGIAQYVLGDYGQFEGALRVNLLDRYFPIIEVGLGRSDAEGDVTHTKYYTSAPYFRIGADYNLSKNKHDIYRIFGGVRYAMTSFKCDISNSTVADPNFGGKADYHFDGVKCSYHWAELVLGVDAKLWGPIHLGWSARYRKRLAHKRVDFGDVWYVPGYGVSDSSNISGTFNIIFDI